MKKSVEMKKVLIGLILLTLALYINGALAVTYKSYVDQDYGFYRVVPLDLKSVTDIGNTSYINKTLNILVGDSVVWTNDASPDWPLTIISEQGLWGNRSAYLRWNYQKFNYTFNESGTYTVYIKEFPRLQHQKIIVLPIETPTPTPTMTPIPTKIPIIIQIVNKTPTIVPTTPTNKIPGFEIILILTIVSLAYIVKKINIK